MLTNPKAFFLLLVLASALYAENRTIKSSSATPPADFLGEIVLVKTAPASAALGETFTVSLTVTNNASSSAAIQVNDFLANAEPVDPLPTYSDVGDGSVLAALPPRLSWSFDLPAGASREITYRIKPLTVGVMALGPAEAVVQGGKFFSNPITVKVECSQAPSCDESIGETAFNCPSKCGLGANASVPEAPMLVEIPTAPIPGPVAPPVNVTPPVQPAPPLQPSEEGRLGLCGLFAVLFAVLLAAAWSRQPAFP